MVLPFGIERERKPRNWDKKQEEARKQEHLKKMRAGKLGKFVHDPNIDKPVWKPRQKIMQATKDQVKYKPSVFILRQDPADKKVMYIEQDLMAKSISDEIDKVTGYTYRIEEGRNVVVRRYFASVNEDQLQTLINDFVGECNRILYLYCDTR